MTAGPIPLSTALPILPGSAIPRGSRGPYKKKSKPSAQSARSSVGPGEGTARDAGDKTKAAAAETSREPPPPPQRGPDGRFLPAHLREAAAAAAAVAAQEDGGVAAAPVVAQPKADTRDRRDRRDRSRFSRAAMVPVVRDLMWAYGDEHPVGSDSAAVMTDMMLEFVADLCRPLPPTATPLASDPTRLQPDPRLTLSLLRRRLSAPIHAKKLARLQEMPARLRRGAALQKTGKAIGRAAEAPSAH